jgi:sRNA-binding protein
MTENQIPGAGGTGDSEEAKSNKTDGPLLTKKIAQALAEKFSKVFSRPVPLAIGIHAALAAALPEFTPEQISAFLREWCGDPKYLRRCRKAGRPRFNLAGQPEGAISEREANYAKLELAYPRKMAPSITTRPSCESIEPIPRAKKSEMATGKILNPEPKAPSSATDLGPKSSQLDPKTSWPESIRKWK